MLDVLENIFGEYEPIVILDTNNEIIGSTLNIPYICGVILFAICLIYLLKTIGGLIYEWLR